MMRNQYEEDSFIFLVHTFYPRLEHWDIPTIDFGNLYILDGGTAVRDGSVRSGPVLVLMDPVRLGRPDRTWSKPIKTQSGPD